MARELRTEILIEASPERVWEVLTDWEEMPKWNPFITEISGELEAGEKIRVHLKPPEGRGMTFKPRLVKVDHGREIRWLGHLGVPGLFDGEHIFEIDELPHGQTRFVQREEFKGVLSGLILRSIGDDTLNGFAEMNEALKERAEALA
ncbi:MAG: SRPBCC domain-containing protein [Thermoplasmata archaeon]|nr:SRPBCC domain-containing protein [Thermoplasmata archaeon]